MMGTMVFNHFINDWPHDYHLSGKNKAAYKKQQEINQPHISKVVNLMVDKLPINTSILVMGKLNYESGMPKLFPKEMLASLEIVS